MVERTRLLRMKEFKSIIAIDLETTGLPSQEHNMTKVTELAMVGCEISHCKSSDLLPRVLNKLVLCFNPYRKIHPMASNSTGLDNEMLCTSSSFKVNTGELMKCFIERLPQPVCFVAHNGNKFDYPIVKRELEICNVTLQDVYCVDSLLAFRHIFPKNREVQYNDLSAEENALLEAVQKVEDVYCKDSFNKSQSKGFEHTPATKTVSVNIQPQKLRNTIADKNNSTVRRKLEMDQDFEQNNACTKKRIVDSTDNKQSDFLANCVACNKINDKCLHSPPTYKLGDIYKFLHEKNFNSHRAEEDCLALLSCIICCKELFFPWLEQNATEFNSINSLF